MNQQLIQESVQQLRSIAEGINNPWVIWVPLLGVLVALLLGIIGIFQDWIRACFKKPNLKISIKLEPPDCHKTSLYQAEVDRKICDTYYFRFRIENDGNYYAENTEAMITEVYKKGDDKYEKLTNFLPLNLVWSHYGQLTIPKIQPKLFKHLDFGHILKSDTAYLQRFGVNSNASIFFEFDVAVRPNTGSHILLPGDYKIKIVLAGNNLKPQEKTYRLILNDRWDDDEQKMLKENISIKEI